MGGYRFLIADNFELEPSALLKTTENWNPQGDFSLRMYYLDLFWAGASYRTNQSIIAMVGLRIDMLHFGYSFDWALSEIGHFNYGSHEITLSIKLGDNARRYKWLNRY
jgi:type IX secretion system PorP/SprF family membrane protein